MSLLPIPFDFKAVKKFSYKDIVDLPFTTESINKSLITVSDELEKFHDIKSTLIYINEVRKLGFAVGDICHDIDTDDYYKLVGFDSGRFRMRLFYNGVYGGKSISSYGKRLERVISLNKK